VPADQEHVERRDLIAKAWVDGSGLGAYLRIHSIELFNPRSTPMYNVYVDQQYYEIKRRRRGRKTEEELTYGLQHLLGPSVVNPRERAVFKSEYEPRWSSERYERFDLESVSSPDVKEYHGGNRLYVVIAIVSWYDNDNPCVAYLKVPGVASIGRVLWELHEPD
jgi:hypothetical protein